MYEMKKGYCMSNKAEMVSKLKQVRFLNRAIMQPSVNN